MNQINLKDRSLENLKALAYDIIKTLDHYKGVLSLIEGEVNLRAESEKPENKETPIVN